MSNSRSFLWPNYKVKACHSLPAWDTSLNASKSYQCWVESKAERLDSHQHSPSWAKRYPQTTVKGYAQPLAIHAIEHLWSRGRQTAPVKSTNFYFCAILCFPHSKTLLGKKKKKKAVSTSIVISPHKLVPRHPKRKWGLAYQTSSHAWLAADNRSGPRLLQFWLQWLLAAFWNAPALGQQGCPETWSSWLAMSIVFYH